MPGIAINGSVLAESTKADYVSYGIESYKVVGSHCVARDEFGRCTTYEDDYDWEPDGSDHTGAKVTGTVTSSSKLKIGGISIAVIGDRTIESWVASPPVPSDTTTTRYTNISPGKSGSGTGSISGGSNKLFLGGKKVALIGSSVSTSVASTTTILTGSPKVNVAS